MLLRNTCVSLGMAQTRVSRLNFWRLRTPGAAPKRSGRGQKARRFIVLSSAPIRASPLLAVLQMGLCICFFFFLMTRMVLLPEHVGLPLLTHARGVGDQKCSLPLGKGRLCAQTPLPDSKGSPPSLCPHCPRSEMLTGPFCRISDPQVGSGSPWSDSGVAEAG